VSCAAVRGTCHFLLASGLGQQCAATWGQQAAEAEAGCRYCHGLAPPGARQGDASRAWQHLETANRLQRARIHYSPAGADALLRTLRDLFLMPPDAGRGVGADAAEMSSARATLRVRAGGASRAGRDAPERR